MAAKKKKTSDLSASELQSVSNTLMGVSVHLGAISNRESVDLSEPREAVEDCMAKLDAFIEAYRG